MVINRNTEINVLHVRTLGGLRQTNDDDVRPLRRKPLALLSYVARRSPSAVTRTELATLFWGERGEERARQSLRQALLELKQVLADRIDIDPDSVRVAAGVVDLDIVAFEGDLSEGRVPEAVARWSGDFFEGAEDIGGDGFRRWIDNERASLHGQLGTAMQKLIGDAGACGRLDGRAAAWAQRWAEALPFEEAAHLRLIESLRMNGRNSDALGVHAAFVTRARAALDIEPSPDHATRRRPCRRCQGRVGAGSVTGAICTSVVGQQDEPTLDTERQGVRQATPNKRFADFASSKMRGISGRLRDSWTRLASFRSRRRSSC